MGGNIDILYTFASPIPKRRIDVTVEDIIIRRKVDESYP